MTRPTDINSDLTAERLRELFLYDPETGIFTWRVRTAGSRREAGERAGHEFRESGYRCITVKRRRYREHRAAWLYMTGRWPSDRIDHINGNTRDNRFCNLREVTDAGNNHNRHRAQSNNRFGLHGVYVHPKGKFLAHIRVNKKKIHLGSFDTPGEAEAAYMAAKLIHHPEYVPGFHNKPSEK